MDSPRWARISAGVAAEREAVERPGGGCAAEAFRREYSSMSISRSRAARSVPKSSLDGAIAGCCWRWDDEKEDEGGAPDATKQCLVRLGLQPLATYRVGDHTDVMATTML